MITLAQQHASQLAQSERGRHCLKGMEVFLDQHAWSLDSQNQRAAAGLVLSFLGGSPCEVLNTIREQLSKP